MSFISIYSSFAVFPLREPALTLLSMPNRWPAICHRTGSPFSTACGSLWSLHRLSTPSWSWLLSTLWYSWWRSVSQFSFSPWRVTWQQSKFQSFCMCFLCPRMHKLIKSDSKGFQFQIKAIFVLSIHQRILKKRFSTKRLSNFQHW